MGFWGITMRESDYGLDLLGAIIDRQLKALNFSTFKVADALEVIKVDIMEEIRLANRGCSATDMVFYFSENLPHNFTRGALLITETDLQLLLEELQSVQNPEHWLYKS